MKAIKIIAAAIPEIRIDYNWLTRLIKARYNKEVSSAQNMDVNPRKLSQSDQPESEDCLDDTALSADNYQDGNSLSMSQSNGDRDASEMNDTVQSKNQARKKRERRSKDDNSKRNYVCGCGKMYLSYAALYTHAKVKHNGVFPEGTTTLHKKKQGRPKVVVADLRKKIMLTRSR